MDVIILTYVSRQKRKKLQSKLEIKAAFTELILENNNANCITVSEIIDRPDYNRSTFYVYYKNKNELMEDLFNDAIKGLKESLDLPFLKLTLVNKMEISTVIMLVLEHIEKNKNLFKALHVIQHIDSIYDRMVELYNYLFTEYFVYYQSDTISEINHELQVSWRSHAMMGVIKYWIESNFKYSSNYICEQMILIRTKPPTTIMKVK